MSVSSVSMHTTAGETPQHSIKLVEIYIIMVWVGSNIYQLIRFRRISLSRLRVKGNSLRLQNHHCLLNTVWRRYGSTTENKYWLLDWNERLTAVSEVNLQRYFAPASTSSYYWNIIPVNSLCLLDFTPSLCQTNNKCKLKITGFCKNMHLFIKYFCQQIFSFFKSMAHFSTCSTSITIPEKIWQRCSCCLLYLATSTMSVIDVSFVCQNGRLCKPRQTQNIENQGSHVFELFLMLLQQVNCFIPFLELNLLNKVKLTHGNMSLQ